MQKHARLSDNIIVELFPVLPDFHPDFVSSLVPVPADAELGMVKQIDGSYALPAKAV